MASAVAELEGTLQEMANLKAPGVTGSKITKITSLCVDNVQSESVLVQKIFTHFKKAAGTHKLGALYVVDSVTRKWLERAKGSGQAANEEAADGTFAAGVRRVTELMPVFMNDIVSSAPMAQKDKIKKLVDIWERGQTFPLEMLKGLRAKIAAMDQSQESTTPKGSPPVNLLTSYGLPSAPPPPPPPSSSSAPPAASAKPALPNTSAVMEALANIARLNTSAAAAGHSNGAAPAATPVSPPPVPVSAGYATASYNAPPLHGGPVGYPGSSTLSPVNGSQPMFPMAQPPPPPAPAHGTTNSLASILGLMAPAAPAPAPAPAAAPGLDPAMQRQLAIIQTLVSQGVPYEQIPALMQSMLALAPSPTQGQYPGAVPSSHGSWSASAARPGASRDEIRSPTYRGRSRSRSPGRGGWHSPRGNGHERFGDYGRNSPSRDGRRDYRQRSPRRGRSPTPPRPVPRGEKLVEYDRTLPRDHIKVLSRTLFVGGVTCSEAELRSVFTRFGEVQTCIVNREKRHAFVKMTSRKDAETAKAAMEKSRGSDYQFRTRWGVGFGPRDCSDFNNGPDATGTSIIPIHKLTEADCKWMLSAEFGGSGGKPIEHGLVVEEPDIEIGAGVSSKAISRRLQTGKGGGPDGEADDRDGSNGYGGGGGWRAGGGGARRTNSRRDDGPAAGERPAAENPMLNFPYGLSNALASLASYQAAGYAFPDPNQTNQH